MFVNFNGDFMRFFGLNFLGYFFIVIVNCIVNCIYMCYCYYELNFEKEVEIFCDNVLFIMYGDDNMVNSGVFWFNYIFVF